MTERFEELEAKKMAEYEMNLKLDRMTQRAFGDGRQKPPKKPLSVVDVEVIKEYQKQFNEPVREYETEIDVDTGEERIVLNEDGTPIFKVIAKKYRVVPPPELDVVEEDQLADLPSAQELRVLDLEMKKVSLVLQKREQDLKDMVKLRKEIVKSIDDLPTPSKFIKEQLPSGRFVSRLNPYYDSQLQAIVNEKERRAEKIDEVDNNLDLVKAEIDDIKDGIEEYTLQKSRIPELERENQAKISSVKKINSERVKAYQETLNLMNRGAFQQDQMPNETEEDYLERLQANAEQEYTDETLFEADMDIKRKFKQALKKLIRDDIKIEQVSNGIREDEIEIKNNIIKRFPLFRKKFTELYGINNPAVSVNDIRTFIDVFSKSLKGDRELRDFIKDEEKAVEEEKTELELAEQDINKVYIVENPINGRKVYFRIAETIDGGELHLIFSFTGKRGTYKEFLPTDADLSPADLANDIENSFVSIRKITGITKGQLSKAFDGKKYSHKWIIWLGKRIESTTDMDIIEATYQPDFFYEGKTYASTMGWGIKEEEIPEIVQFGKIKLALNKLFYKNILSVRHNNLGRIAGFPNVKVSDDLVSIIMKIAKGDKIIKQEIDSLKNSEQILYDSLLSLANLHKKIPNNQNNTIKELKDRMDIITGLIEAGNDNKLLVKELYQIVHSLKSFGVITNSEATKYLSQF